MSLKKKDLVLLQKKEGPAGILKEFRNAISTYVSARFAAETISMTPEKDATEAQCAEEYSREIEMYILAML